MNRRELAKSLAALGVSVVSVPLMTRGARAAGEVSGHTWAGYDMPEMMGGYLDKYGGPPEFSYIASDIRVV